MSAEPRVFASAADARYGLQLLNLVGSLQANSDVFDRIVVFDLGLNERQRAWLAAAAEVELRTVPEFVSHWNRGFTWKPWAWVHTGDGTVVWVDAGATVLRSLEPMLERIRETGYFLVSQGNAVSDILPESYFELYGLPSEYATRPYAAAGILGFRTGSEFFERVVVPTYEDCLRGLNLGFSAREAVAKNTGLGQGAVDVIHDCPHFRWDQSVFNAQLLHAFPDAPLAPTEEFGWRSASDSPHQLIWHHRRRGSLRYVTRIRTAGAGRLRWLIAGLALRLRWWLKRHRHQYDRFVFKARLMRRRAVARL